MFSAIQGEGCIVGRRQVFVRFGQCDVHCAYCDTPLCHVELERAKIERTAGRRDFEVVANPVSFETLGAAVTKLAADTPHHSASLTGGEPLLHPDAVIVTATSARSVGLLAYLETNGHLVDAMTRVGAAIDIVGMDIKVESTTGFAARHAENRSFLAAALEADCDVFCKVVVGETTSDDEIVAAASVVRDVAPKVPFILQPVTPFRDVGVPPAPERLLEMQDRALDVVSDVRVIPQTHKMIRQL